MRNQHIPYYITTVLLWANVIIAGISLNMHNYGTSLVCALSAINSMIYIHTRG